MITQDYYNNNANDFFENTIKSDMKPLYERFEKHLSLGDSILDLGCGSGRDSLYFSQKGFLVTSVDNSIALCKLAKEQLHIDVRVLDMCQLDYINEFDAIWASASILHISRSEIGKVLKKCHKALKENGIFYLSFKYGDIEQINNDRFFNNYTPELLVEIMVKNGFYPIDIWTSYDVRPNRQDELWTNGIFKVGK